LADVLVSPPPLPGGLDRARGEALRELAAAGPARSWRLQARTLAATVGVITLVGVIVVAAVNWPPSVLLRNRWPAMVFLGVAQVVGLIAAIAPGRSRLGPVSWALAALGVLVVLAQRHAGAAGAALPGWICSASHLAVGLVPLTLVVRRLRDIAFSFRRAFTAGLALGVSAPLWGEVACERGFSHTLIHHVGSLVLLAVACLVLSRTGPRRSYAP
jgi:hypothetical protein